VRGQRFMRQFAPVLADALRFSLFFGLRLGQDALARKLHTRSGICGVIKKSCFVYDRLAFILKIYISSKLA
jgi:hypothetical protein